MQNVPVFQKKAVLVGNINVHFVLTTRNPIKGQQLLAVFEICLGEGLVFHTVVAKAMVKAPSLL